MFSVIISEKGGAERRESFDRTEINVGRVQGNDLMLPKGNVSKRHARLLYRDGRFIVTDLKSTNGTYVNGRKIAQATIVREGDKIYIGDFVLRIESSAAAGAPAPTGAPIVVDETPPPDFSAPPSPLPMDAPLPEPTRGPGYAPPPGYPEAGTPVPPVPPAKTAGSDAPSSQPASSADKPLRSPRGPRAEPKGEVISHFPLENDPDESLLYALPGPPRVPGQHPGPGQHPALRPDPSAAQGAAAWPSPPQPLPQPPQPPLKPIAPAPRPVPSPPFEPARSFAGTTVPSAGVPPPPALVPAPPALVPAPPALVPTPPPLVPLAPAVPALVPASPPPINDGGYAPKPPPQAIDRATSPSTGMATALGLAAPADVAALVAPVVAAISSGPALTPQSPVAGAGRLAMPPARLEPESIEPSRVLAHRAALVTLLDKVGEIVELRALETGAPPDETTASRIERAITEQAAAMRSNDELRPDIDAEALVVGARRELLEYGPLTMLVDDEDVSEIHVTRHDYVLALHGRRQVPTEVGFSSERSLARVVRRLCFGAGRPLAQGEVFVERRLARGARLFAVLPTAPDQGHMLVIRKPQRADLTLEDLVRSGTISRAMAGLLGQCIEARANILVTGTASAGATSLLGALAAAGSTADRVVVLQEDDELVFNQPHTVSILLGETPEEGARAVQAAARLRPDRLVVGAFAGRVAAEVVDAMGDGADGVLAASRAPTLRQAAARLTADLAATKLGLGVDVAREWLASSFDLAIEIARLRDGRHRVLRIAELGVDGARIVIRDIFTFAIERTAAGGAIEGSFHPTGFIPGIVEDLAARGVTIDPSLFKRHAGSRP